MLTISDEDARTVLRALERQGYYLMRRIQRPSSKEGGKEQQELDRVRRISKYFAEHLCERGFE